MEDRDMQWLDAGRQTPYLIPEGFFEKMQLRVMEQTTAKEKRRHRRLKTVLMTMAGLVAMLGGILMLNPVRSASDTPESALAITGASYNDAVRQYANELTKDEMENWVEFTENDLFMNINP